MSDDIVGLLLDRAFRLATRDFNGDGARLAKEAADEILRLRAENEKLRAALKDCADDLEAEINTRYGNVHPALQRRYDRDMASVRAAAAALKETGDD